MPGRVVKFPEKLRVPHIGWNQVEFKQDHAVFGGLPSETFFYFVHSYYVETPDTSCVLGETDYGMRYDDALLHADEVLQLVDRQDPRYARALKIAEHARSVRAK